MFDEAVLNFANESSWALLNLHSTARVLGSFCPAFFGLLCFLFACVVFGTTIEKADDVEGICAGAGGFRMFCIEAMIAFAIGSNYGCVLVRKRTKHLTN